MSGWFFHKRHTTAAPKRGAPMVKKRERRPTYMSISGAMKEVRVRADMTRVIDIDLQKQHFTASLRIEASWTDPSLGKWEELGIDMTELLDDRTRGSRGDGYYRISEAAVSSALEKSMLFKEAKDEAARKAMRQRAEELLETKFWSPRLKLRNMLKLTEDYWWMKFYPSSGGQIACYRWDITATFQELMELKLFPFDHQDLTVELVSLWEIEHPTSPVVLVKQRNEKFPSLCNNREGAFIQSSEYVLHDRVRFEQCITEPSESSSRQTYSQLKIACRVDRRANYWILNVILPLFIVTTSLFASFQVPYEDVSGRFAMNLTLLLALTAFKYVISDKLPNISYLTIIDSYLLACFATCFIVLIVQIGAAAHIFGEPHLTWDTGNDLSATPQWTDVDTWWSSALSSAANGAHVITPGGAHGTAEVNLMMVGMVLLWLLTHVIAGHILWKQLREWKRTDQFFNAPADAIWISPLSFNPEAADDSQIRGALQAIKESLTDTLGPGKVADVLLWSPTAAEEAIRLDRGEKPPSAAENPSMARGESKRRIAEAMSEQAYRIGLDPYVSSKACAVVRFHHEQDAADACEIASDVETDASLANPLQLAIDSGVLPASCILRPLNMAYYALAHPPKLDGGGGAGLSGGGNTSGGDTGYERLHA